jgi:hypothetical protein
MASHLTGLFNDELYLCYQVQNIEGELPVFAGPRDSLLSGKCNTKSHGDHR